MATVNWNANKDNASGADYGSGADVHLCVGYHDFLGSWARAYIGFSYSWSGWTAINSATLHIKSGDGYHNSYAGDNVKLYIDLITASWSEGSAATGHTWHSSDDISPACSSTNRATLNITDADAAYPNGAQENTWYTKDVTGLVRQAWNNGSGTFYGIRIMSSDEADSNERMDFWSTEKGSSYDAYITVDYSTNTAPTAPDNLQPRDNLLINNLTPRFTADFNDPDLNEIMKSYQINLYADNGTSLLWDSGTIVGSVIDKTYNGPSLTGNTFYQWTVRAMDDGDVWGPYQTTKGRFKVNSIPNGPALSLVEQPTTDIKTLTPTFNITHSDPDTNDPKMTGYRIYVWNSDWTEKWNPGYVDLSASPTETKQVTYSGSALEWNKTYYWSAYTYDSNGVTNGAWVSYPSFHTHDAGIPINLTPTGSAVVSLNASGNPMPTFAGSRASSADSLTAVEIKVFLSTNLASAIWTSPGSSGVTSTGFSRAYGGTTLSYGTTYCWQAKVTSSVGGDSEWSALQYFTTPASGSISMTAPVSPVTDTTPDFTFDRSSAAFTHYHIIVYKPDGGEAWNSGTQAGAGPRTVTYAANGTVNLATLAFNTTYSWKVRVSADGGSTWGAGWSATIPFSMDSAGIPTLNRPTSDAWLGGPEVLQNFDFVTGWVNGINAATSIDTAVADKKTGRGSLKIAITSLAAGNTSATYKPYTKNLDKYGGLTPLKVWVRASTLTNLAAVRLRFVFSSSGNYAEYYLTPSSTAWEQKTLTKGSPFAAAGLVNWSNVTEIQVRVISVTGAYTGNINVDDLVIDASAPVFEGTTENTESISTFSIRVYPTSDGSGAATWDSGPLAGSGTTFSKLYNHTTALTKGTTYYWQASYVKSSGAPGGWSALRPFVINSAPSIPSSVSPASGTVVADDTTPAFTATFTDPERSSRGDTPTAYEVEVYTNHPTTPVHVHTLYGDANLSSGANSMASNDAGILVTTGAASPVVYETEYQYRARYYDSMGYVGAWSSYAVFKPSESPTATLLTPADSAVLGSPALTISWSMSSPGSKGQNSYELVIYCVETESNVLSTGRVYSSDTSYSHPAGSLQNGRTYEFRVRTWDTDALPSAWHQHTATTDWTGPAAITDFVASANVESSSVICRWVQSNIATNTFRKYTIYRKLSSEGTWQVHASITNQSTTSFYDYETANTISYDYKITQWSIVPGDADLESADSDFATEVLDADSWYVIGADKAAAHIFELPVVSAPFVEPVQQEVFEPLGTSRKVIIRGRELGAEGNMQCRWKDEERVTAKMQVNYIKNNAGPHILKSPFGDIWFVEFSGPSKDYLGGGGMLATLTWTEVDE